MGSTAAALSQYEAREHGRAEECQRDDDEDRGVSRGHTDEQALHGATTKYAPTDPHNAGECCWSSLHTLPEHTASGAECQPQADLVRPLRHDKRHYAVNPDCRQQERDAREARKQHGIEARARHRLADDLITVLTLPIGRFGSIVRMTAAIGWRKWLGCRRSGPPSTYVATDFGGTARR